MGKPLDILKIIKLLNNAPDLTLDKNLLMTALDASEEDLYSTVKNLSVYSDAITVENDKFSLKEKIDLLDDMSIFKRVEGSGRIAILDAVDSTNTFMIKNASMLASGDVVIAEIQSEGRGSRGGKWHSGLGKQLTLSVCYLFDSFEKLQGLSVGIGVATAISIERFGFENILLKWPNDVYMDTLKVGGILIETVPYKDKVKAIIGVGLNVYDDDFGELTRDYGAMYSKQPDNFKRNDLAAALINNIKRTCEDFNKGSKRMIFESFKARDEMLGKMIQVDNVQGSFVGRAAGIDNTGALLLAQDDKKISIRSGHITYLKDQ
ncbi:biotin--[acetyl-CoA-carboxylase] ligase [Succinivibrio dextrinosolvens]|uniref:biotin--[acetyl-CoA-carboxylase] ligase n=1 Tax=Succinivibrio dextrinosolvens TaxID=83771 RepID=UPI00241FD13A|nr:biotin--[acetyl-CoA-carboxylase] ligase [Succinivibrio dextrinosolvens]MBE6424157.1 biotin--[acetyl-CoA-carboxylase] ligase [Succinivibrio dextrinosolvens]